MEGRRRRVELGLRRHRRHPLTGRRPAWRRALLAAALLVAALGVRIAYVEAQPYHTINDAGTYNRLGSMISRYGDYHTGTKPRSGAGGSRGPTAYFPPAYPYYLAVMDLLDGHQAGGRTAVPPERIEMAVTGAFTVGLIGLVGLEAFGSTVALVAMAIAAFYPVLVELSGVLVAENLLVALELAATWMALRARRARAGRVYGWIAGTGVLTGLATLTHENAFLFVIPFALAAGALARRTPAGTGGWVAVRVRALAAPAVLVLVTCATIAPWTIRNSMELHHFVPVSDETGITLVGTYNPQSAANPLVPYKWKLFSHLPQDHHLEHISGRYTEVALGDKLTTQALSYIGAHPLAPLDAALHNTLRMFEVEGTYAWHASALAVGISASVAGVGVISFYVLCGLALIGAFTRRARSAPRWLWAIPILYAVSIVFVNVETPRFREPIDPFFILLAACAVSAAVGRLSSASGLRGAPVRRRRGAPQLARDETKLVQMVQGLT